jgi:hypothetical protein
MKLQTTLSLAVAVILLAAAPAGAIVGGDPEVGDQFPYYVHLFIQKNKGALPQSRCGGSVIDTGWILTAAHCIWSDQDPERITSIRIDVLMHDAIPQAVDATSAIGLVVHPLWDGDASHGHDLALVRVPDFTTEAHDLVPAAKKVQVGAPADPGAYAPMVVATLVGHGEIYAGSGESPILRFTNIPLQSDDYMDAEFRFLHFWGQWIPALMIGAGWSNHTACHGDSGGPLTVDRGGVTVQVGVASFVAGDFGDTGTIPCDKPSAYAELSGPQLAWVAATVPGVAARWGSCAAGVRLPGHWVATYEWGLSDLWHAAPPWIRDFYFPDLDSGYRWKISCVPNDPVTWGGAPAPGPVVSPGR